MDSTDQPPASSLRITQRQECSRSTSQCGKGTMTSRLFLAVSLLCLLKCFLGGLFTPTPHPVSRQPTIGSGRQVRPCAPSTGRPEEVLTLQIWGCVGHATEFCFFLTSLQHASQLTSQLCLELEGPSRQHGWHFWPVPPSSGGTAQDSPVGLKQEDLVHIDADSLEAVHLESQGRENHQQCPWDHKRTLSVLSNGIRKPLVWESQEIEPGPMHHREGRKQKRAEGKGHHSGPS